MALTDMTIRAAKPGEKTRRISDSHGLFIEIRPNGARYWRMAYRFQGKQKMLAFGVYPDVTLAAAREKREESRRMIAAGVDPGEAKKVQKETDSGQGSFKAVAREWHARFSPGWSESHSKKLLGRLEKYIFPWIGARPVEEITAPEILSAVLRRIEERGHLETAHRALQLCGQVFRYAVQTGRADRDPSSDLKGAIPAPSSTHFATIIKPEEIGHLLRAIESYSGSLLARCALSLAPLVLLRPGEIRKAEWQEFDFDRAEWRIPVARMKRKKIDKERKSVEVHIVPLSRQALQVVKELIPVSGDGRLLFPGLRSKDRSISDATMTNALRRLGYTGEEMTVHGFRHMASTLLHEKGYPSHLIEKQLAHSDRNRIRAVYNYAEYLPERRKMLQEWADYLDALKAGAKIIPISTGSRTE